jgi:hypothetical protein
MQLFAQIRQEQLQEYNEFTIRLLFFDSNTLYERTGTNSRQNKLSN